MPSLVWWPRSCFFFLWIDQSNLQATIRNGSGSVLLFNSRTPRDVLEWLRDIGNSLNDLSSGITFVETLGLVPRLTAMWDAERKCWADDTPKTREAMDKRHKDQLCPAKSSIGSCCSKACASAAALLLLLGGYLTMSQAQARADDSKA